MTKEEHDLMMVRQQKIFMHRIRELQKQKNEIDKYVDQIPDREYMRLKRIVDNETI